MTFVDVTAAAGLDLPEPDFDRDPPCEEEHMLRGAAAADFDGDGALDLFVARVRSADLLFFNRGDGTFEERGTAAGVAHAGPTNGALAFDVEGDGDLDLYVTSFGPDPARLYVNDGAGRFREQAEARGVAIEAEGCLAAWSASAADVDGEGDLDLHTTAFSNEPDERPNDRARLLLNDGTGHFEDATAAAGLDLAGRASFTSVFGDVDSDGDPDLAVCADWGHSGLFVNRSTSARRSECGWPAARYCGISSWAMANS